MRKIHFGFILGFFCLIFLGDALRLFEVQELGFLDIRFRLRGSRPPHPDITIVEIDDESIKRIGHWPWPRGYHATLLDVLSSYQPRLILYDILFTEASTEPKEDQLLSHAIEKAGNVITAFFYRSEKPFNAVFPLTPFGEAARFLGYVNIFPDADARIRRVRMGIYPQGGPYYHTSVVAALAGFRDKQEENQWLRQIPVDRENSFWINFPGNFSVFPRVPFYQLIEREGTDDAQFRRLFQGKIVVVGQTATGGGDFRATPFSAAYPGVGLQAAALHTLLTGNYLFRLGTPVTFVILLILTLFVTFLTWKNPHGFGLVMVLVLALFYLAWNDLAFLFLGWILPVFSALLVIFGTYVLTLFLRYLQIQFERELLTRELSLAAQIQENFLPQESPQMAGVDIGFQCRFARIVGGDLYDWVRLGERKLGICVGDVSGKGVPAALYMARAISEWRSIAKDFNSASALLEALNFRLVSAGIQGVFMTLIYLILDLDSKSILFSNAGHEPFYLYRNRNRQTEWIRRGSAQPLGIFEKIRYPEETLPVEEGDVVVLISDGVRELRNPKGEELGLKGAERALDSFPQGSADQAVKQFFRAMDEYSRGRQPHDDQTVLCVKIGKGGK